MEVFPSQLSGVDAHGRAGALRELFDRLLYLDHVVVFIDEVEDIASGRLDELAARSQYFSAADIEFAAQKAAQAAFERSVDGGFEPATTEDFLKAVSEVRPSISATMARDFDEDIERFARF